MSYRGPSGRGVASASQAPHNTRTLPSCDRTKVSTSEVLPIPASPPMNTLWPRPSRAVVNAPSSSTRGSSRSSNTTAGPPGARLSAAFCQPRLHDAREHARPERERLVVEVVAGVVHFAGAFARAVADVEVAAPHFLEHEREI